LGEEETVSLDGTVSKLSQTFIPYSTVYREDSKTMEVSFKGKRFGSPGDLKLELYEGSKKLVEKTLPSSSIGTDFAWIPFALDLSLIPDKYLSSNSEHSLILSSTGLSSTNYYVFKRDSVDTNYLRGTGKYFDTEWRSLGADLTFKVQIPQWIFPAYPRVDLERHLYPRVAVDIVGKPRISERWITDKAMEEFYSIGITVYSRFPDELDKIVSDVNHVLFVNRTKIPQIQLISPQSLSQVTVPLPGLFSRTALYRAKTLLRVE
jgi:hypothetical protein